jgi:hypothetical protein
MGKQLEVPGSGVKHLVEQAYEQCEPYQWAREALVNSGEAGATKVRFGVDPQGFEFNGVARRFVEDNGCGMDASQLREFMGSFGGGGHTVGGGYNFGQGLKAASFMWNKAGVIIVSWTKGDPDGNMVWILEDKDGNWEFKDFEAVDEDGDVTYTDVVEPYEDGELGIDFARFKSKEIEKTGQGTVVLFLGNDLAQSTHLGDAARGETSLRGIVGYLNQRFLDLPSNLDVKVETLEAPTSSGSAPVLTDGSSAGDTKQLHARTVIGLRGFIPADAETGLVTLDTHGTKAEWFLQKTEKIKGDSSYGPGRPQILYRYDSPKIGGRNFSESYERTDLLKDYRNHGISSKAVAGRAWIIIHAPEYRHDVDPTAWGVAPQASRARLHVKGGTPLPKDEWAQEFFENMPEEIVKALRDSWGASSDAPDAERLKRVAEHLTARWKGTMTSLLKANAKGKTAGSPFVLSSGAGGAGTGPGSRTGGGAGGTTDPKAGSPGTSTTKVIRASKKGTAKGSTAAKKALLLPDVRWKDASEFASGEEQFAATYDEKYTTDEHLGLIIVNKEFPMFEQEFEFWKAEYPKADPDKVVGLVKDVYAEELITKIAHSRMLEGKKTGKYPISTTTVGKIQSPEALTMAVIGLQNVEARIRVRAGSAFGKATPKAGAVA